MEKQASWPVTRDNLLNGQIDACHGLFSLPLSVATGLGGNSRDLRAALVLSQNGQAITLDNTLQGAGYGDYEAAGELLNSRDGLTLAMTFPGGTHDTWLRYWLTTAQADVSNLQIQPIPPPQMVQN
ncbi:MAG: ABC transporter substrate-binding protein, partial [Acidimicrobiales bacterium]